MAEEQMKWQPIETAPKDGTEVLSWNKESGHYVVYWRVSMNSWLTNPGDYWRHPTHWQPLPEPPKDL